MKSKTAQLRLDDPFMSQILTAVGGNAGAEGEIKKGLIGINHFSPEHSHQVVKDYDDENFWDCNGVADSPEQAFDHVSNVLKDNDSDVCVFVTHIDRTGERGV